MSLELSDLCEELFIVFHFSHLLSLGFVDPCFAISISNLYLF